MLFSPFIMNKMKKINLVYKLNQKRKNCEQRCGGSSVNGICFNKINFFLAAMPTKTCYEIGHSNI